MRNGRRLVLSVLFGLALAPSGASAMPAMGLRTMATDAVARVGFGCGRPELPPCPIVQPYPVFQHYVVPYPSYRAFVAPRPVSPCAVHVWDVPYPCREPQPVFPTPCPTCGY